MSVPEPEFKFNRSGQVESMQIKVQLGPCTPRPWWWRFYWSLTKWRRRRRQHEYVSKAAMAIDAAMTPEMIKQITAPNPLLQLIWEQQERHA